MGRFVNYRVEGWWEDISICMCNFVYSGDSKKFGMMCIMQTGRVEYLDFDHGELKMYIRTSL